MSEGIVARYMKVVMHDMIQNNQTEIKWPCKICKLKCYINPYSGLLRSDLLSHGFMYAYTRWISDEDDDNVHGAVTGNDEEGHGGDEYSPGHDDSREDAGHGEEDQDVGHGEEDQDARHGEEDQDVGHRGEEDQDAGEDGTPSGSWVQNPYVQALFLKHTSNARDVAREKAKLASLEKDTVTPLYAGCRPGDTRLDVILTTLQVKARHKWTDRIFDEILHSGSSIFPRGTSVQLVSRRPRKSCALSIYRT
jgi:hypothetical protein